MRFRFACVSVLTMYKYFFLYTYRIYVNFSYLFADFCKWYFPLLPFRIFKAVVLMRRKKNCFNRESVD